MLFAIGLIVLLLGLQDLSYRAVEKYTLLLFMLLVFLSNPIFALLGFAILVFASYEKRVIAIADVILLIFGSILNFYVMGLTLMFYSVIFFYSLIVGENIRIPFFSLFAFAYFLDVFSVFLF